MSFDLLTKSEVSNQTGWVFQAFFIIWSIMNYTVFIVYWTRFKLIVNQSPLEKAYFYFIAMNVIGETLRVIDPFSIHGIYPFYANRLLNIFCGGLCSTCFGIVISDTLHAVLHRINKEVRASYFRYCTLISLLIVALPALIAIVIICLAAASVPHVTDATADRALQICFVCCICGLTMMLILILFDIIRLRVKPTPPDENENELNEPQNHETERRTEIVMHAKERLMNGLYLQCIFVCFVIIGMVLELMDGAYAMGSYYFGAGLLWGIALRFLPLILLYTQWIDAEKPHNARSGGGDDDDGQVPIAGRQTTVGFLRKVGHGVDLKRVHTLKRIVSLNQQQSVN